MTHPNDIVNAMEEHDSSGYVHNTHYGLTKREYFAAMAMQGMLANQQGAVRPDGYLSLSPDSIAIAAVNQADELITQLNQQA